MKRSILQKNNFKSHEAYVEYSDELISALWSCKEVFEASEFGLVDAKYGYRGDVYYQMLKSFLTDRCYQNKIDAPLAKCIVRDLQHLVKDVQYMGRSYLKLSMYEPYTRIKMPRIPFALYTLKCRMPSSNWYGGECSSGKIKPKRIRAEINNKFGELNLPYSGVGEYSLENIAPSGSAEDWRSILHFHYVIPFLSMKTDAVVSSKGNLSQMVYRCEDEVIKAEVLDQLTGLLELSSLPDLEELWTWWRKLCENKEIGLAPIDVHRQDKVVEGEVLLDKDGYGLLEQDRGDWERMDKYSKKSKFLQWNIDRPKMSLGFEYVGGERRWFLFTHHGKTYRHRISGKLLLDHYRNVRVALPQRARNSFALEKHPLHRLLCRQIPFELSNEVYRTLLTRKDDLLNMFNF